MSLVKWEEPKPCALSRPRFVKIRVRDGRGVPTGETYTKRVGRPLCVSGAAAVKSLYVNGATHHLCAECGRGDLYEHLGLQPDLEPVRQEWAAPAHEREGELVLVRTTPDTRKLRAALARAGWVAKARTRTVKRAGFLTATVSVWVRP
jgi:hypothetical protein